MPNISINGIEVLFPYTPYKVQEDYMKKVIECLQNKLNGVLESPTGTGKTLSLFCSSLAWLESKKAHLQLKVIQNSTQEEFLKGLNEQIENSVGTWSAAPSFMIPKIIYSSRTHIQLSQAVQELKRSNYRHVRTVVLGSRDQLCLHPEVSKIQHHSTKIYMCRSKIKSRSCPYHLNVDEKIATQREYHETAVLDVEDLITLGKKHTCCPYYASRNIKDKADMVLTPYNYIIDPKTRKAQGIELEGNIVILDEAHNIEGVCEDSMSFQLTSKDLALCITEVTKVMETVKQMDSPEMSLVENITPPDFTMHDLSILKVMFCELEEQLDKEVAKVPPEGSAKPGDYMVDILSRVELTPEKSEIVIELVDKIIFFYSTCNLGLWSTKGAGLQKFVDLVKVQFSQTNRNVDYRKELTRKYRVYLQPEVPNKSQSSVHSWVTVASKTKSWKIDCWCFSPGIGMQNLIANGAHSVIITSGTLSPLPPLISELGINMPVQLENPHIIGDKQVFVGVITQGPDGTSLNSSYRNRFDDTYINSLGRTISNFCRLIPDGVLVFFPSYSVLRGNVTKWEEIGVWQSLSGIKPVFTEPQNKDAFQESMEQFYSRIEDPQCKGATLLAVCRGKVSEGLDFADRNARGVIITGLPFPPSMDPKIKLKMSYLDATAREGAGIKGNDWYVLQASRAINQAIGRVIRHKNDYGAILLCDNRFADKRIQSQLSQWVQGRIKVFNSFGMALKQLSNFFKEIDPKLVIAAKSRANRDTTLGAFSMNNTVKFTPGIETSNKNGEMKGNSAATNIFAGYMTKEKEKTPESTPTSSKRPSSIFECFNNDNNYDVNTFNMKAAVPRSSNICNVNQEILNPNLAKPKRMKISIQLKGADQSEATNTGNTQQQEKWKTFLIEVKTALQNTELYNKFCCSVRSFRSTKDTAIFASEMCDIFSKVKNTEEFLKKSAALVNPQQRQLYLNLCLPSTSS